MTRLLKVILLALFSFIILGIASCSQTSATAPTQNPSASTSKSPYWGEAYGRFYTKDLARAQEEIPFPIVLPSYIPDKEEDSPLPEITGPLREYQHDDKVDISILYFVDLGGEVLGTVEIQEFNYCVLPPMPELNPEYKPIEIRGKRVIKDEGDFGPGPGAVFYFNRDDVYFIVGVYNFSIDEATKVIESMLE